MPRPPAAPDGPFIVIASCPVDENAMPKGLRNPYAQTGLVAPNGLSEGTEPFGLYRSTLPRTSATLWALGALCSSPRVTYSFRSSPNAIRPPLWQQSLPAGSVTMIVGWVPVPLQSYQRMTSCVR